MLDRYRQRDHKLAELLICTGFMKPVDLDRSMASCRDERKKLTESILSQGLVKPDIVLSAIEIMHEIEEGRLTMSDGRSVLYLVGNYKLSLEEAVEKLGLTHKKNPYQVRLDSHPTTQEPTIGA